MSDATNPSQPIAKLRSLIKDIGVAMLSTTADDGSLHSRPMSTGGHIDDDFTFWFFTYADSLKVEEIGQDRQVNVSFACPDKQEYVSVSGVAHLVTDRSTIESKWSDDQQAWFPQGIDQPGLALLKVVPHTAEYWDAPPQTIAQTIAMVKAVTTGERAEVGEHETVNLG
ncbi:MAG: pyridoxamine 5'-phosphate oxidase family protein [Cyanobacteria bacterium P01_A01_bin.135]